MGFFNNLLKKLFGSKSDRDLKRIKPIVEAILEEYEKLEALSNDDLRAKTNEIRQRIMDYIAEDEANLAQLKIDADIEQDVTAKEEMYLEVDKAEKEINAKIKEILDEILPEAFAIVKDTARRFTQNEFLEVTATDFDRKLAVSRNSIKIQGDKALWANKWIAGGNEQQWAMIHYDVQLIGGIVLHEGGISEMSTGEGKTLVATLPVFLNALTGRGVHMITVNDYLSKRDSEWMGPLFEFHGLKVDCIDKHEPNTPERRDAYAADITFGTNNEYGFDYLRDNMAINTEDLVQRGHNYAIVDEVDSVLIDDARTPLIISGPVPKGDKQLFDDMKPRVVNLVAKQSALVRDILNEAKDLIKKGDNKKGGIALLRAFKGLPKNKVLIKFLSETGMKTLLHETENIYLAENAKRMPEVTEELYFVIDEKNHSVDLTDKGLDVITSAAEDTKFFVLPDIGTEITEIDKLDLEPQVKLERKEILLNDYSIKTERIHTVTQLLKAYSLFEKDVEYVVMDNKVKIVDEQTGRILDGRRYSDGLHQAIEAKENVKIEAATQTFATVTLQNYFRMYNKLAGMTGTAETEAGEFWDIYKLDVSVIPTNVACIRKDYEDMVYKTKREKYNAIIQNIEELIEKGRPVLVGTTSVEVSELLSRMLNLRKIKHNVLNAKLHQKEADIVADAGKSKTVTIATNMAGRGTDIKLTPEVKTAGGLAIIGTERHDSRRVDRQLIGRAGRQGDPGTSQFYASLEDDLMRMFGSDRISKVMDTFGHKEGDVIQHSLITKSIERAQKKVEENNFGIRKRLLEYDDVMNSQRNKIYQRRRHALHGERISMDIMDMIYKVCANSVATYHSSQQFDEFVFECYGSFGVEPPVSKQEFMKMDTEAITEKMFDVVYSVYQRRADSIVKESLPTIADVYKNHGDKYENIVIPLTDGNHVFQIMVNLKKAVEPNSKEVVTAFQKSILLHNIDSEWKEHLREMDELKQSVQNAVYEQKDPLLIYKMEAYDLFESMVNKINKQVSMWLLKAHIFSNDPKDVREAQAPKRTDYSKLKTQKVEDSSQRTQANQVAPDDRQQKVQTFVRDEKKIGRNDPCPCGSGKKYKQCHGKDL